MVTANVFRQGVNGFHCARESSWFPPFVPITQHVRNSGCVPDKHVFQPQHLNMDYSSWLKYID